jgi:hypothetical protein
VKARLVGLVELVGENGVGDQLLDAAAAGRRAERVGYLVAPRQRLALVAVDSRRGDERDPDVVDGQGVLLQRPGGVVARDQFAPGLDSVGDRLSRPDAGLGEVPDHQPSGEPDRSGETSPAQDREGALHPLSSGVRGV